MNLRTPTPEATTRPRAAESVPVSDPQARPCGEATEPRPTAKALDLAHAREQFCRIWWCDSGPSHWGRSGVNTGRRVRPAQHGAVAERDVDLNAKIPPDVLALMQGIAGQGVDVYLVGGAVRDLLLGRPPKDWDLATPATPAQVLAMFPAADTADAELGVLRIDTGLRLVEVASFRREILSDSPQHRPLQVVTGSLFTDARRRDLSINALYYDVGKKALLDPCHGLAALRLGTVDVVGQPIQRLRQDPVRALRAIRIAADCGMTLAPHTAAAIQEQAKLGAAISNDRVRSELTRMLTGRDPARALALCGDLGVLGVVVPPLASLFPIATPASGAGEKRDAAWRGAIATLAALGRIDEPMLGWAVLIHAASADVDAVCRCLNFPRPDKRRLQVLVDHYDAFETLADEPLAEQNRFLLSPEIDWLLTLFGAVLAARAQSPAPLEYWRRRLADLRAVAPKRGLLDGRALVALGAKPGPQVGVLLSQLDDLAVTGRISDVAAATRWAQARITQLESTNDLSLPTLRKANGEPVVNTGRARVWR